MAHTLGGPWRVWALEWWSAFVQTECSPDVPLVLYDYSRYGLMKYFCRVCVFFFVVVVRFYYRSEGMALLLKHSVLPYFSQRLPKVGILDSA